MLFFIGQILPYIAAAIFIVGVSCRITGWLKAPVPFELTMFHQDGVGKSRMADLGRELLLFDSLRRGDMWLWLWAWLMHAALLLIIIGHIAGIYFLTKQFTLVGLSAQTSTQLSAFLGSISGWVLIASLTVLFYRRTADPELKRLTDPADYFDLMLLMAIAVTGMHMRTGTAVDLPAVRTYIGGLLTLHPAAMPQDWRFISHFTLVNILLIYFPFSKLMHLAGSIVSRLIITQQPPVYPSPAGFKRSVLFGKEVAKDES